MDGSPGENEWNSHGRYRLYWSRCQLLHRKLLALRTWTVHVGSCSEHNATARPEQSHHPSHPALLTNRCCRNFVPRFSFGDIQPESQDWSCSKNNTRTRLKHKQTDARYFHDATSFCFFNAISKPLTPIDICWKYKSFLLPFICDIIILVHYEAAVVDFNLSNIMSFFDHSETKFHVKQIH